MSTPMLDARDVAQRLNVSRATAYREMKKMIHVVVGKRAVRVAESALDAYLRRHTTSPISSNSKRRAGDRAVRIVHPRTQRSKDEMG